jgi:glycerol-3-phosphate dehydrogenase (NAD(P)+)
MFTKYGHDVTVWSFSESEIERLSHDHENKLKLPGVMIPDELRLTSDPRAVENVDIIVSSVPTFACRSALEAVEAYISPKTTIVSTSKGFESGSLKRMSEVIFDVCPSNPCVVLTGPSHAEEVGRYVPTAVTAASLSEPAMLMVEEELSNEVFRIYHNADIIGCELGGALKNIIALSCGICDGLSEKYPIGDNTKAALMTRGLSEIARLGVKLGASQHTFAGLSGLGDLIVTCTSLHSRNFRAGILIGRGVSPASAVNQIGTVEGYACCKSARELALKHAVSMPITEQCYGILYGSVRPIDAVTTLMDRPSKEEYDPLWL